MESQRAFTIWGSLRQKGEGIDGDIFAREKPDEVSFSLYKYFLTLWGFFIMRKGDTKQGVGKEEGYLG